jgi:hypothetical protein
VNKAGGNLVVSQLEASSGWLMTTATNTTDALVASKTNPFPEIATWPKSGD